MIVVNVISMSLDKIYQIRDSLTRVSKNSYVNSMGPKRDSPHPLRNLVRFRFVGLLQPLFSLARLDATIELCSITTLPSYPSRCQEITSGRDYATMMAHAELPSFGKFPYKLECMISQSVHTIGPGE